MAGFAGSGGNRYGGKAGSWTSTKPARNSIPGSWGGPSRSAAGPARTQAGPQRTQAGPRVTQAGPGIGPGGPGVQNISNLFNQSVQQQAPTPFNITPPKVPTVGKINVTAQRNPDLDRQLGDQRQYTQQLKDNTSFASNVLAHQMADQAAGAKNAAKYIGGAGGAGARQARMNQIDDATTRANAQAQAQMLLGREQMVGNFMNQQMNPIMGQQQGMLQQQGVGLQAEGLRQNAQNTAFNQALAGTGLQMDAARFNRDSANQAFGNQLAANDQTLRYLQYLNPYSSMRA